MGSSVEGSLSRCPNSQDSVESLTEQCGVASEGFMHSGRGRGGHYASAGCSVEGTR